MLSFFERTLKKSYKTSRSISKRYDAPKGYTQKELSSRSGVSLGSLKRFESYGQISLESLLKLALVLECLEDFEKICLEKEKIPQSIEEL